ncbi:unnamed protein product [Musa acuminata subsp. burmannicoides]
MEVSLKYALLVVITISVISMMALRLEKDSNCVESKKVMLKATVLEVHFLVSTLRLVSNGRTRQGDSRSWIDHGAAHYQSLGKERILTAVLDSWVDHGDTNLAKLTVELHPFGKRGTSASKREIIFSIITGGTQWHLPDEAHVWRRPARPGPARPSCHESRTDGRDHRPHTTLHPPIRRDPFLLSHIVVLESPSHVRQFWGFFTGFRGEPTRPSGFHRSLPVVTISPPLSRIHVGGFTFFGFSAERWMYPSFSKMVEVVRWSDTDASARRLVDCGDYDGDLYREDPLESEGGFGTICR